MVECEIIKYQAQCVNLVQEYLDAMSEDYSKPEKRMSGDYHSNIPRGYEGIDD